MVVGVALQEEDVAALVGQRNIHVRQADVGGIATGRLADGKDVTDVEARIGDVERARAGRAAARVEHEANTVAPAIAVVRHGECAGGDDAEVVGAVPRGAIGIVENAGVGVGDVAALLTVAPDTGVPRLAVHVVAEVIFRHLLGGIGDLAQHRDHGIRHKRGRTGATGVGRKHRPAVGGDKGVREDVAAGAAGKRGADVAQNPHGKRTLLHHRDGVVVAGVVGDKALLVLRDDDAVVDRHLRTVGGKEAGAQRT